MLQRSDCHSLAPSYSAAPTPGTGWPQPDTTRQGHTLLLQFIDVSHDGSEEGSLVGVIVHAAGHKVSQLLTRWCHWPAPAFIESLFL